MAGHVEALAWDSAFFGFPIGRVDLDDADEDDLARIEGEARDLDLRCLYGSLDPRKPGYAAYWAQGRGFRLVEAAVTLERPAGPFTPPPCESVVRHGTVEDLPILQDAIAVLGPWSRFGADPRFGPEAARRMFEAWVRRAAADDDRLLTIAEDASGVTGVAAHVRGERDRIDLMGVTKPGTGIPHVFIDAFLEWAGHGATEAGPCATRNMSVIRFLERDGYRVCRAQYHFHRWFDEPDPE
jgi:hypothetical protein